MFNSILETVVTVVAKSATRAIDNIATNNKRRAERKLTRSFSDIIRSASK